MNLMQIKYYLEICNTLNFTSAAQNLYVSQPSLSRQIQLLEEELDVQLLIRSNRSVELTEAGMAFRDDFIKISSDIEIALKRVKKVALPKKEIRVGIFQAISSDVMGLFLEHLKEYFIDYRLYIYKYNGRELKNAYEMGKIDLMIVLSAINSNYTGTESRVIIRQKPGILCKNLIKSPDEHIVDMTCLNGKKLIGIEEEYAPGLVEFQLDMLDKLGVHVNEVIRVGDIVNTILHTETEDGFALFYRNEVFAPKGLEFHTIDNKNEHFFEISAYWKTRTHLPLEEFFEDFEILYD